MEVVIEQGALKGLKKKTLLSNKPYVSFLGIPYAQPPVNDLRFKAPVKHPGWSGVLNAVSERDKCTQYVFMTNHIVGSEDCLYLNISVPQQNELNGKLAVMIFIHGGAFNYGSGSMNEYSPDYFIDENVIVVTINYRLNALGFLNLDIDECPGNVGLKDQLFAIKWVKANIAAFGGDVNNITIFGESAGSASVHYHTISPQSRGLFQKAIMQSGSAFNPWAFTENHKASAYKLAKNLGCLSNDPKEILKYLKNVSAIDLVKETEFKVSWTKLAYSTIRQRFFETSPAVFGEKKVAMSYFNTKREWNSCLTKSLVGSCTNNSSYEDMARCVTIAKQALDHGRKSGSLPIALKITFSYTNCALNILGSIYQLCSKHFRVDVPIALNIFYNT